MYWYLLNLDICLKFVGFENLSRWNSFNLLINKLFFVNNNERKDLLLKISLWFVNFQILYYWKKEQI